jgi:phospholipid/cholesterol/gamma-HCH transport system substrate-binding protein
MQRYSKVEVSVGAFVVVGGLALAYLSLTLGGLNWSARHFALHARFSSVGQLKTGDPVKLAGVGIGEVGRIALASFAAEVELRLDDGIALPDDTIASVQSAGLLGDSFVALSPGASEHNLASGGRIRRTEPAVSLTELIAKYAFGSPLAAEESPKPHATTHAESAADSSDSLE